MEAESRRGKDLGRPSERRGVPTSGFGMPTGVEEAYRALVVAVVRKAAVDYAEGVRLSLKARCRVGSRRASTIAYRAASAKSFFSSGRCRSFCDIDGEYLMREIEGEVMDELKSETRAVFCFGG